MKATPSVQALLAELKAADEALARGAIDGETYQQKPRALKEKIH